EQTTTLSLVTSDILITEEILQTLAEDPHVAFAEPNYLCELPLTSAADGAASDTSLVGDLTRLQWGRRRHHARARYGGADGAPKRRGARGAHLCIRSVRRVVDEGVF
ncbi:MAG: hypothetical protein IJ092_05010, partial [Atopobiaceae bacterium]|nr:hypothetical protein [Atopobiaceae bacterium]